MPKPTLSTFRAATTRRLLLPVLSLLVLLAVPTGATAGTYAVDACQRPDGAPIGREGWTPTIRGSYVSTVDGCSGDIAFTASWAGDIEHSYGDFARWTFSAPEGTVIRSFAGLRNARAAPGRDYGTPVTVLQADGEYLERCGTVYSCMSATGAFAFDQRAAGSVSFGVECGGAPGGRCPVGDTFVSMKRARLVLADEVAPGLIGAPSGSLVTPSATSRVRTVNYNASDIGGGIYRQRLLADGREVAAGPVDENGGRCVRYQVGNGFSSPVPCRTTASGSLTFDTGELSDGSHDLELQVFDATDENKVVSAWTIQVDNAPPTISEVEISGVARQGEVLRCRATVAGQAPRLAYQWSRARADGSDATVIAGATEATYTPGEEDVGRKLQCKVTATDGGGSATKSSSLSGGSFADGALVKPRAGGATTGGNGAAGPAGTSGASGAPGGGGADGAPGPSGANGPSGADGTNASNAAGGPVPVCASSVVAEPGPRGPLRRSYKRSSFTMSGRLAATSGGGPVGNAQLDVLQSVTRAGAVQRKKVASTRTQEDGSFRVRVPSGPTRTVQVVAAGCGSVGAAVSQRVRGAIQANTTTRRIRNRQVARIRGRVLGGYVGRGLPLELQVRVGSSWRDVKAVTSNARGEYRVSYRFLRTYVRYTYRFRVVSRAGSAWPYMTAKSGQVKVRVN